MAAENVKKILTKNDLAYNHLKEEIMNLKFQPGDKITIHQVSKKLGFSDIPVREALNKLASEGLVSLEPHVGFIVSKISNKEILEKLEVKAALEVLAIEKAARYITESEKKKAAALLEQMENAQKNGRFIEYYKLLREYSLVLYSVIHNDSLINLLKTLFHETSTMGTIYSLVPQFISYSIKMHKAIFENVCSGDGKKAAALMKELKDYSISQALESLSHIDLSTHSMAQG